MTPTKSLDDLYRVVIFTRDRHRCVRCGGTFGLAPHHVKSKGSYRSLRYEPLNGVALCMEHHTAGKDSAHAKPLAFRTWFKSVYPERFELLTDLAKMRSREENQAVKKRLEAELRVGP